MRATFTAHGLAEMTTALSNSLDALCSPCISAIGMMADTFFQSTDRRILIHHAFSCPYLNMRIQKLGLPHFLFVFVPLEFLLELTGDYPDVHSQAFTGQEQTSFVLCESTFNRPLCPYHFPD